jgi:hypothetical protein
LSVGIHSITAHYNGDGFDSASTSASLTETLTAGKVLISITYSPSTVVAGQVVTFTVGLSNIAATGTITLFDGAATIGTGKVSGGQATFSTSSLSGGNHTITANYSGDGNFNSTFASITLAATGTQVPTTITIASNVSSSVYSGSNGWANVTLTASISPYFNGSDGSTVSFYATNQAANGGIWCHADQGTPGCQVLFCNGGDSQVSVGKATCVVTGGLYPGTSSITAVFSGDNKYLYNGNNNYLRSTSAPITQIVNLPLSSVNNPLAAGKLAIFYASTGWPFNSGGIMTFYDGTAVLGVSVVSAYTGGIQGPGFYEGLASFETTSLGVGNHSITAVYTPVPGLVAATSQVVTQTVTAH